MTGVAKNTVIKLLVDLGKACAEYQDKVFRNLTCAKIQCDEIWAFVYAKEKNVPEDKGGQFGYVTFGPSRPLMQNPNLFLPGTSGTVT